MGVLGEMFPGPKISDEAAEAGDGQPWRLGPIDLDAGVVEVHRPRAGESSAEVPGGTATGDAADSPAASGPTA